MLSLALSHEKRHFSCVEMEILKFIIYTSGGWKIETATDFGFSQ